MKLIISALSMSMVLTLVSIGSVQTVQKKGLTLDGAKKVIAAAVGRQDSSIRARLVKLGLVLK